MFTFNPLNGNTQELPHKWKKLCFHSTLSTMVTHIRMKEFSHKNYVYIEPSQCQMNSRQRWIAFTFHSLATRLLLVYFHSERNSVRSWIVWVDVFLEFNWTLFFYIYTVRGTHRLMQLKMDMLLTISEYCGSLLNLWRFRWSFWQWIWPVFCLCRNSRMPQTF